jgi:YjbE family integral membrane protein
MMHLTLLEPGGFAALAQVLMIDVVLAGDNAVVIGLAAARVPENLRKKVVLWGLVAAVVLRVGLAFLAVYLISSVTGIKLAGGLLLLLVCWHLWRDLTGGKKGDAHAVDAGASLKKAIFQIALADVSMSLDNVLGVAGAALKHPDVLALGLLLSVALMGAAANLIARLLERHRWISYIGLLIVLFVAVNMIWHGGSEVMNSFN